eukprot:TRINITY_DN175_c0_g2_i1.p1 TRINITY_DN175_c0_g2~~TRINITY_DN175_c0_g2_i1.p1  ORF type:complete len:320 (+),score=74.62 TRINITY_DN175_c0_g2_i1:520-1479(+)
MASSHSETQSTPLNLSALMSNIPLMITAAFVPISFVVFFISLGTNTFSNSPAPTKQTGIVYQLQTILSVALLAMYQLTSRGRHASTHKTNGWFLAAAGSFPLLLSTLAFQGGFSGLKLEAVTNTKAPFHFTAFLLFVILAIAFILALPIYGRGGHVSHPAMIKLVLAIGVATLLLSQVLGYIQVTKKIKEANTFTWSFAAVQIVLPQWATIIALIAGVWSCNTLLQVWSLGSGTSQFISNFMALISVANQSSSKGSGLLVGCAITGIVGVILLDGIVVRNLYKKALRTTGIGAGEHANMSAPISAHQGAADGAGYNAMA